MAALTCQTCELFVVMKRKDAKTHGWTVKDIEPDLTTQRYPFPLEEVWTCPHCNQRVA